MKTFILFLAGALLAFNVGGRLAIAGDTAFVPATQSAPSQPVSVPRNNLDIKLDGHFSEKAMQRLARGEAIVEVTNGPHVPHKTNRIMGAVDIAAPPDLVWQVMGSCEKALSIVPHIRSCDVLERGGADADEINSDYERWDVRRHVVVYSRLFPKTTNEFISMYRKDREIRFSKHGGDLKTLEGAWRLEPRDEGRSTRVIYEAVLAIGQPVPGFLLRRITRGDTKEILFNLRDLSEQELERNALTATNKK